MQQADTGAYENEMMHVSTYVQCVKAINILMLI